ncbi:MAG: hypothetical protein HFI72_07020 [Peptococcaceae bacterium]|nr:hypothetical protein [Peptococcaceae bacterium]
MKECSVYYESWQYECCGRFFRIGETIKWLVYAVNGLDFPFDIGKVEYYYEAHSSDWQSLLVLEGTVTGLQVTYVKYEPSAENEKLLLPCDGRLLPTESIEHYEQTLNDMEFSGFLVTISDYVVRPARQEEVTFV